MPPLPANFATSQTIFPPFFPLRLRHPAGAIAKRRPFTVERMTKYEKQSARKGKPSDQEHFIYFA